MVYIFEGFVVDDTRFTLTRQGEVITIEPKVFELLLCFCQNPNVPISRDELIDKVWHQRIVSNAAINRAVSELRKNIEVDPSQPQLVKTVSKVGYIFNITPKVMDNFKKDQYEQENGKTTNKKRSYKVYLIALFFLLCIGIIYQALTQKKQVISLIDERPASALKGTAFKAKLSKNGQDFLFLHKDSPASDAKIWLQPKGQPAQLLTADNFYYISAIFASNELIYAVRFNNLQQRECEIVSIEVTTQISKHINDCAHRAITHLAYDDEQRILYFNSRSDINKPFSIFAYYLDTGQSQQLTLPYAGGNVRGDYMLALAPKKKQLAIFEYQKNSTTLLKILDLVSKKVSYHHYQITMPGSLSWLDETHLLISESNGVVVYNIESQKASVLNNDESIGYISANPSTLEFIYDKGYQAVNLVKYSTQNNNDIQAVTSSNYLNYKPQLANRSNKIAYISTNSGELDIIIKPVNGNSYRTNLGSFAKSIANFHWSTNDESLIASVNNKLYIFSEQDKKWQQLETGQHYIHYAHFSTDDTVIFSSDFDGDWQIWSMHISSGIIKRLSQHGGYSVQGDINEEVIYLTKFNHQGIFRLNTQTGQEELVIADFPITAWAKWQKSGDNIYYSTENKIMKYQLASDNDSTLFIHDKKQSPRFSVSYDSQALIFEGDEQSQSNIWQGLIQK